MSDFLYGRQIHYVDYLESTGTQYIDTGVVLSSTDKVEASVEYTGTPTQGSSYVFGTFGSSKNFGINCTLLANPKNWYGVWYNQGTLTSSTIFSDLNTRYDIQVSSSGMYINDNLMTTVSGTFTGSVSAYLFWANGTSQPKSLMKLYWAKFWQNNVLVRDYLPAIDENGVGFVFDRVTHTIYDNAGTGAFNYPARELEYIETDGTSFINTGYTPSGSTETEITTMLKNQDTSRFMFGCRSAQNSNTYACLAHNSNRIGYRVGDSTYVYSSGYNELNVKHTYKIANGVFYRDDVVIDTTCQGATTSPNTPLALLTINTNNVLDTAQTFVGNFYSCTIKENNTLVRDFIPVFQNGQAGMIDKVNNVFYDNDGTGTFTVGKIVEPEYE